MAESVYYIRQRLHWAHGRTRRTSRRTTRPRRLPAPDPARRTLVGAARGRGAAVGDGGRPRPPVGLPGRRGADPAGGRRRRGLGRQRPLDHRRRPGHADPDRDPPRPGLHHRRRPCRRRGDEPGRAQLGQQRGRRDRAAHRRLPDGGRGDPAAAPRAAPHHDPARTRARHPAHRPARRGGGARRAGPGGGARPAPRPAADHPAPHLVRPAPVRSAGVVRRAGRPRGRPGAPADAAPPRAPVDRRGPGRPDRRLAGVVRAPLHRAGRRAADGVPHRLADRARRRPAARARRHDRVGGAAGRLRDAVRPECGVQARARDQPARPPTRRQRAAVG